ncbi:hypothetical protein GGI42DRAFT_328378 [Trichoderma sp. SZMC 28013]
MLHFTVASLRAAFPVVFSLRPSRVSQVVNRISLQSLCNTSIHLYAHALVLQYQQQQLSTPRCHTQTFPQIPRLLLLQRLSLGRVRTSLAPASSASA